MKSLRWLSLATLLLLFQVATTFASVNSRGVNPGFTHSLPPTVIRLQPCRVLWFGPDNFDEIGRLSTLGLAITGTTNPADLSPANLASYDVLVVAYTGSGSIGASQFDIGAFVAANNGLLIHQPNVQGALDYAPAGCEVLISSECWCHDCNTTAFNATIVNGAHPITSGLADADLSGDFDETAVLGANYTVLARNANCSTPALAAGALQAGRVVFETGNASTLAFDPGSDAYWARIFEFLCVGSQTPTADPTWGRVKVLYR